MRKLEIASSEAWATLGVAAPEFVALGFEDPFDETITWFELKNQAGAGEFYVEAEDVMTVLRTARDSLDPGSTRYLWHSHYIDRAPSAADVSNFPDWVDVGMVFHTPSGEVALYNSAGIIGDSTNSDIPRDTLEVSSG